MYLLLLVCARVSELFGGTLRSESASLVPHGMNEDPNDDEIDRWARGSINRPQVPVVDQDLLSYRQDISRHLGRGYGATRFPTCSLFLPVTFL